MSGKTSKPPASAEHPVVQEYYDALAEGHALSRAIRTASEPADPMATTEPAPPDGERDTPRDPSALRLAQFLAVHPHATVLVVDDDYDIRAAIAEVLEEEGYRVHTAADGLEGLIELDRMRVPPDVILVDVVMPKYDGWAFMGFIGATTQWAHIPLLIISANAPKPGEPRGGWIHLDEYRNRGAELLEKPFRLQDLMAAIKARLQLEKPHG